VQNTIPKIKKVLKFLNDVHIVF